MRSRAVTRLAAFGLVLAGTFGSAYALGERLPGHSHGETDDHTHDDGTVPGGDHGDHGNDDGHGDDHGSMPVAPVVRTSTDLGYTLVVDAPHGGTVHFHLERAGTVITDYTETHGAMVHVVLVRPDLSEFHHVHPAIEADGTWTVELPEAGPWTVVSEVMPRGASREVVVAADTGDRTGFVQQPLPGPLARAFAGELVVDIDAYADAAGGVRIAFGVAPFDGLEPYLGMPAHLVVLAEGDLAFAHLHPASAGGGRFEFAADLTPGSTYRVFLQFGNRGEVVTVPFTIVWEGR